MDELSLRALEAHLATRTLGRRAVVLDTVGSTNSEARRMMEQGSAAGLAVIADEQTGGRGRRGRAWVSCRGCGLWMTAVVQPQVPLEELQKMTLLAGLAVCRAVRQVTGNELTPAIKWPNDVLANGRKLCGILCETAGSGEGQAVVVGIGVNTKTPEGGWGDAEAVAISLEQAAGRVISRMQLAAAILNHMESLLDSWQAAGFAAIAAGYRQYMLPRGTAIALIDGEKRRVGSIDGLDDGGGLLVRLESGEIIRIISGEITVRGMNGYV